MAISCEQAKTWAIVFGVYSGILTGVIIGFLFLWFLKRKVTSFSNMGGSISKNPVVENHSQSQKEEVSFGH